MNKKNITPKLYQPVNRVTTGQLSSEESQNSSVVASTDTSRVGFGSIPWRSDPYYQALYENWLRENGYYRENRYYR